MIAATGKSLSIQAYNLIPKIAEVDSLLVSEERRRHIVEAHPELAFMRLYGSPLPHPKKSTAGAKLRTELLGQRFGVSEVDDLLANRTMPVEDALDALVLLVTAQHLRAGTAALLGDGRADAEDRPVRMAY